MRTVLHVGCVGLAFALLFPAGPVAAFDPSNVVPGTGTVEYAFTPGDDAAGLIVRAIDAARTQVLVQAFSFTHREIADALVRARKRGLDVQVIADAEQLRLIEHNVIPRLAAGGVPVCADADHSAAHNKVVLIDAGGKLPVLVTGSFNFTYAAQFRNAENLLVLHGNHDLANAFLGNWKRHRSHCAPLGRDDGK